MKKQISKKGFYKEYNCFTLIEFYKKRGCLNFETASFFNIKRLIGSFFKDNY